jgi:undecaprenyl-diphosphatase
MTITQAFILGLIQGLTEFIPVSSSGHLVLLPELFNWEAQSTTFDIILHGGTLLALLIYFRERLLKILKGTIQKNEKERSLFIKLVLGTIPALLVGFIITLVNKSFDDVIDESMKSNWVIVVMMIALGILLIVSDYVFTHNRKTVKKINNKNAIIIGIGQCLAYIRGTSRSGVTILTGLTQGLDRHAAAEFAFLIGIPIIAAAFFGDLLFFLMDDARESISVENAVVGFLTAFISGLLAIRFMLRFLSNNGLKVFGIYRIVLGIVIILTLL